MLSLGSTIQTAGLPSTAVSAVHGSAMTLAGSKRAAPNTDEPSVMRSGVSCIASFTRTVPALASIVGEISLTRAIAVTEGSLTSASVTSSLAGLMNNRPS